MVTHKGMIGFEPDIMVKLNFEHIQVRSNWQIPGNRIMVIY